MATRPVRPSRDFRKFRLPGSLLPGAEAFANYPQGILFRQVCNALNLEIHGPCFWKGHLKWAIPTVGGIEQGIQKLRPILSPTPLRTIWFPPQYSLFVPPL